MRRPSPTGRCNFPFNNFFPISNSFFTHVTVLLWPATPGVRPLIAPACLHWMTHPVHHTNPLLKHQEQDVLLILYERLWRGGRRTRNYCCKVILCTNLALPHPLIHQVHHSKLHGHLQFNHILYLRKVRGMTTEPRKKKMIDTETHGTLRRPRFVRRFCYRLASEGPGIQIIKTQDG